MPANQQSEIPLDLGVQRDVGLQGDGAVSTRYGTARAVIGFLDFFGVLTIIIGAGWFILSLFQVLNALADPSGSAYMGLSALGLLPSLGLLVGGVLVLAHGQMLRASLDTADLTRELLAETKALSRRTA